MRVGCYAWELYAPGMECWLVCAPSQVCVQALKQPEGWESRHHLCSEALEDGGALRVIIFVFVVWARVLCSSLSNVWAVLVSRRSHRKDNATKLICICCDSSAYIPGARSLSHTYVAGSYNFLAALDIITTVLAQQRRHKLHP